MKWQLLIVMLLLFPAVMADDFATVNKQVTLWTDVTTGTAYYPTTGVNITIYNSTGGVVLANAAMQSVSTGLYKYNFTPTSSGVFYTSSVAYNNTYAVIGLSGSTFTVSERGVEMGLVILFAIAFIMAAMLFLTFQLDDEYKAIKLLLLLVSVGLFVLMAYVGVEESPGSISALTLFYTVCIVYAVFFMYIGFKLVFEVLGYFAKIRVR